MVNRPISVFIADDDEDDVFFVKSAFAELNSDIKLDHFTNGRQLLQELNDNIESLPSFVLLDLNMPVLDGRETLKMIRENKRFTHLPVIILSTSSHAQEKKMCYTYGANNYFTKPYTFSRYLEIIKDLKAEWIDHVTV